MYFSSSKREKVGYLFGELSCFVLPVVIDRYSWCFWCSVLFLLNFKLAMQHKKVLTHSTVTKIATRTTHTVASAARNLLAQSAVQPPKLRRTEAVYWAAASR